MEIPATRNSSAGAGCLMHNHGALLQPAKPAAEISAKSRDEAVVRHQPVEISGSSLLGTNSSSTPAEGESLKHLASRVGKLRLA
jgi:hypothetical protein